QAVQMMVMSVSDGLGAVAYAGLGEDVVDVRLDRGFRDVEARGDLTVREAVGDQRKDLGFTGGKAVGQSWAGWGGGRGRRGCGPGHEAGVDLGIEHGLPGGGGVQGPGDLGAAGVLGEESDRACLKGGEDRVVVR